ncbi:MAG: SEL1-like repeat protein [Deltaproteobacteria bacterium]|jgi:TPR repeat protein|nr:SEL1-like repeat protein [Deltaproteobacteria bacterium]
METTNLNILLSSLLKKIINFKKFIFSLFCRFFSFLVTFITESVTYAFNPKSSNEAKITTYSRRIFIPESKIKEEDFADESGTIRTNDPAYQFEIATFLIEEKPENEKNDSKDWLRINRLISTAATSGLKEAQCRFGFHLKEGFGVPISIPDAIIWLQRAAQQGDEESLIHLAALEEEGHYIHKDQKALKDALISQAREGNPLAQFHLALKLRRKSNGNLQEFNSLFQKAREGFLITADKGDSFAQYHLGIIFQEGLGSPKDYETALKWHLKAAKFGLAKSQYKTGLAFIKGQGLTQNFEIGISWLKKAAEQGLPTASETLAELLSEKPIEVFHLPEKPTYAAEWFQSSLRQVQANFLDDLGRMLLTSNCRICDFFNQPKILALSLPPQNVFQRFLGKEFLDLQAVAKRYTLLNKLTVKAEKQNNVYAQTALGLIYYFGINNFPNYYMATGWFSRAAKQGYPYAQSAYGRMLLSGQGIIQNIAVAIKWIKRAADNGDVDAQNNLAVINFHGIGIPREQKEGISLFVDIAEKKDSTTAQLNLGILNLYGNDGSFPKNPEEAVVWFKKALGKGVPLAEFYLGLCYAKGEGVPQDPAQAVQLFEKAGTLGLAVAQLYVGVAHIVGFGVPRDILRGEEWLFMAQKQEIKRAKLFLGILYLLGLGGEKDYYNINDLLNKLATQPDDDLAQYSYAMWFLNDEVTPIDPEQAVYWFKQSASLGNDYAQNNLGLMYIRGVDIPADPDKALGYFQNAANKGNLNALFNLSIMYLDGIGVGQNLEKGHHLLQNAAELGEKNAQFLLGDFFSRGVLVPQNFNLAVMYFQKAAEQGDIRALERLESLSVLGKL